MCNHNFIIIFILIEFFSDKLNHLSRQKEKLEEKIMDHYRKLSSCSITKK